MLFETERLFVCLAEASDTHSIVEIYNSNPGFISEHLDRAIVDSKWVGEEMRTMRECGFTSGKVVLKDSGKTIGVLDFLVDEECYLSLLMVHSNQRYLGHGSEVYEGFEAFARANQSSRIRIDAVTHYDRNVFNFWSKKGFKVIEHLELNWSGKNLPAVKMKKNIAKADLVHVAEVKANDNNSR